MNVPPPLNETLRGLSIRITVARILLCSFHSVIEGFSLHISSRVILKYLVHEDCSELNFTARISALAGSKCQDFSQNSTCAGPRGLLESGSRRSSVRKVLYPEQQLVMELT